jgi:hypothetical protein
MRPHPDQRPILDSIRRLLNDQSDLWEMQFAPGCLADE